MMHSKFQIDRENGVSLSCHCWLPEKSKAIVLIIHGIGEHAARYSRVAGELNKAGFAVYSFDMRGHGESSGKRGHITSFEAVFSDMDAVVCRARESLGEIPLFIYGHSLGGAIALGRRLKGGASAKGFIATSPWLELVESKPAALIALSRVLKALIPSFTIPTGLNADLLTSDKAVVSQYRNDPLVHGMISAATAVEAIDTAVAILNDRAVRNPLLLAHGKADGICSVEGSRKLAAASGEDRSYLELDGMHELHNEPACFSKLIHGIVTFIDSNLE